MAINKNYISKLFLCCFGVSSCDFFPCHFKALTDKSSSLTDQWQIVNEDSKLLCSLQRQGRFVLTAIKWGQVAEARTSWTSKFIFIMIPIAKEKYASDPSFCHCNKRTHRMMIKSWQIKPIHHLETLGLDNWVLLFCMPTNCFPVTTKLKSIWFCYTRVPASIHRKWN